MLSDADIASLETATLDAVAPLILETLEGWLLPFDHSTIGRAKSAVPLRHSAWTSDDAQEAIDHIVRRYRAHQLAPQFRLADGTGLRPLHSGLRAQGFGPQLPTLVQMASVQEVIDRCPVKDAGLQLTAQAHPQWTAVYTGPGFDPVDATHRVQALSRSKVMHYASLGDAQGPAAAGTVSFSQGWAGVHGMRTALRSRGQGLATQLLGVLAQQALGLGITRMYLQVGADNLAAQSVYQRAGFRTAWTYHYWVQVQ